MNKREIIEIVAGRSGESKAGCGRVITSFLEVIQEALGDGDKVLMTGVGTLRVQHRKAFQTIHPRTGAVLNVKDRKTLQIKTAKGMREKLNPAE